MTLYIRAKLLATTEKNGCLDINNVTNINDINNTKENTIYTL